MTQDSGVQTLKPRKKPVQARSNITVAAIFEATIQVLGAVGLHKLNTARVAARAGVSVGALYQYYPNKHALIAAVLERHLEQVADAVEQACLQYRGQAPAPMGIALAAAFVDAKLARPDVSTALYAVAAEPDGAEVVGRSGARMSAAVSAMLQTCQAGKIGEPDAAAFVLLGAMAGVTQGVLEQGAPAALGAAARIHLGQLCAAYLEQLATVR